MCIFDIQLLGTATPNHRKVQERTPSCPPTPNISWPLIPPFPQLLILRPPGPPVKSTRDLANPFKLSGSFPRLDSGAVRHVPFYPFQLKSEAPIKCFKLPPPFTSLLFSDHIICF